VTIVSLSSGEVQGVSRRLEKTIKIKVDRTMKEVGADEFECGPSSRAVPSMRTECVSYPEVQAFLRAIQDAGKPIAALCHAPWELVSAGPGARTDAHQLSHDSGRRPQCRGQLG